MIALLVLPAHAAVLAVDHRGRPEGSGIAWTSTLRLEGRDPVRLASPIPRDEVLEIGTATADWDGDRLVGLHPRGETTLVIETFQPNRDGARPALVLDRVAPQQISLEEMRFEPDPSLGVTDRVGWSGVQAIGRSERSDAFRFLGRAWKHRHGATVVIVDRPTPTLAGKIEPAGRVPFQVVAGAVAAAVALLGCLFGVHRVLDAFARKKRIEAYFAGRQSGPEEPPRVRTTRGSAP